MAVMCGLCGRIWERDPALEVACPLCGAGVGEPCAEYHVERDYAAIEAGVVDVCEPKASKETA